MLRLHAIAPLLIAATPALAQTPAAILTTEEAQAKVRKDNPSADADVRTGFAGSGIVLAAGSDASDVSLTLSRSEDMSSDARLGFLNAAVVVSAPITDKDRGEGAFLTESGLPGVVAIQGALTLAISGNRPVPEFEARRRVYQDCLAKASPETARKDCDGKVFSLDGDDPRLVDPWVNAPVWFFGLRGAVGRREFDYRGLADFAEKTVRRTEYAIGAHVGVNPNSRRLYLGAGYEYRRHYEAAPDRTRCPPVAVGAPSECFTGPYAEPERKTASAVFGVFRWQNDLDLGDGRKLPIGFALKAAYDTKEKVFGFGLPLYLFSDGESLRGGVRVDWQGTKGKDDKLRFGVFVGAPFGLFGP